MKDINFDACQRTIEEDSFLMNQYQKLDPKLSVTRRLNLIYVAHIKYNHKMYARYLSFKEQLEN